MALFKPNPDRESVEELIEGLSRYLSERYRDAEDALIREVAERAQRDFHLASQLPTDPAGGGLTVAERRRQNQILADLAAHRAVALRDLHLVAEQHVSQLRSGHLAQQIVDIAASEGEAAAAARMGFAARQATGGATLTGTASQAVAMVALSLESRLEVLNQRLTRYPQDAYQRIVALYTPNTLLGVTTSRQQQAAAVQRFLAEGITGFVDRSGRNWTVGAYAEMAGRTTVNRAFNDAGIWRMQQAGINLVTVVRGLDSCKNCAAWAGAILSTDGTTGTVNLPHATLDGVTVPVHIVATVEQARAQGWGHPNCRCRLVAYFPGLTILQSDTTYDEAAEKERAEQRRLEREIRAAKRDEAAAMTPEARKRARAEVRDKQADMRDFIDRTGRHRQSYREQLGFADGRGGADRTSSPPSATPATRSLSRPAPARTQAELARRYGLDLGGDRLQVHEVEFYDRFLAAGNRITYLSRHGWKPTNDFIWHDRSDLPVELKTILANDVTMRSIARPIRDAVKKATKAGVVKDSFIVDLRDKALTAELLAEMRRYNVDNPHARISRLFAMSRGVIAEVDLE